MEKTVTVYITRRLKGTVTITAETDNEAASIASEMADNGWIDLSLVDEEIETEVWK